MKFRVGSPAASLASLLSCGCIATVQETRAYGVSRPAPRAEVIATEERTASPTGEQCRTVTTTTQVVREVDIRRSFVDPRSQEVDVALAVLAGIGSAFVAYDGTQRSCQTVSLVCLSASSAAGADKSASAAWPIAAATAALAAIPLGFVVYNAARVQSEVRTEPAPPITEVSPWQPCETNEQGR